jgi:hypothetical protein
MSVLLKTWIGVAAWSAYVWRSVTNLGAPSWAQALLLFAALVLMPLVLELFEEDDEPGAACPLLKIARAMQLSAAIFLGIAYALPPGQAAMVAALPWIGWTWLVAIAGLRRLLRGGFARPFDRMCADLALLYVGVGGAWVLADRIGYAPLRFDAAIVTLTAVHFHYAGLLLPLFAGLVQRELWFWRFSSQAAIGAILGVPAVALGITATQLRWGTSLESAAGVGLALAGMAVAILHVRLALESKKSTATRLLLGVAGASLFFGMVLAALYALRTNMTVFPWLGLPQMRMLHGTVNAIGFGLCGVLAWRRMGVPRST